MGSLTALVVAPAPSTPCASQEPHNTSLTMPDRQPKLREN